MILDTLSNRPIVGATTSVGSGFVSYLEVLNPMLTFASLCIGICVGLVTLWLQIRKFRA